VSAGPSRKPAVPSPASVVTIPVATSTWRTQWLPESATYSMRPLGAAATPYGHENLASLLRPSTSPRPAPPAIVVTIPAAPHPWEGRGSVASVEQHG